MSDQSRIRALELFAGLGGFSAAIDDRIEVVAAMDISQPAQRAYQHNFPSRFLVKTIESVSEDLIERLDANFWWLSPPCQPFTKQGNQRDWEDPRTAALRQIITLIPRYRPIYLGLENVPAFRESITKQQLTNVLSAEGYSIRECELCPTQFGFPNRRLRYYLLARQRDWNVEWQLPTSQPIELNAMLTECQLEDGKRTSDEEWLLPLAWRQKYGSALHVIDPSDRRAEARCFTSAYGRSPVRSGSYLTTNWGPRFFRPSEILKLLGFPSNYRIPNNVTRQQAWHLAGNSLAIAPVQYVCNQLLLP